ncbi:MAG: magnesium transporter CorA family protein [Thermoleophilia bacterium]|nr:magnesium transporter CorA family protein [Thermoleophilia bacterium]MDH4340219.1 magnesium transporter CorA family protein [Thermoleophilia bacterium]MDH5280445.1 magnesium transporter CorA family protein [Thermoleophilia bacterium]
MVAAWLDMVDPTREEVLAALPVHVDPDVVEALAAPSRDRDPRPLLVGHGSYVFGVLVAMLPLADEHEILHQEIFVVATPQRLVTVRKTPPRGPAYDTSVLEAAATDATVGVLIHRLVDDVADTYLDLLDAIFAEIDALEDRIDELRPSVVRLRLSELRHELLHRRRTVSATRGALRRVLDGRVDVGDHALFPAEVERLFGDTYDTLVRVTEELDVARDLLSGVRDHLQSKIAENQNEVGKKLTVIASLVLVPSLIVGFYGQNFSGEFGQGFWTLGVSTALILASTAVQLALFRWRRWI